MKKIIFLLFLIPLSTFGQNEKEINLPARHTVDFQYPSLTDGPYVFIKEDHFLKKSIKNGVVFSEKLGQDTFNTEYSPNPSTFNNVNKIPLLLNTSLNLSGHTLAEDLDDVYYMMKYGNLDCCYLPELKKIITV